MSIKKVFLSVLIPLAIGFILIGVFRSNVSSESINSNQELLRRIERQEAVTAIQNILGTYTALHVASRQEETCDLYCKKTLGTYCAFGNAVYNGHEGVRNHFIGQMAEAEKDLTGKLYLHEMVTPIIEVAGDCQTAKVMISTVGCETGMDDDGGLLSLWSFARYRFDFAKEDGQWKIWHQKFYITFLTPFKGEGWTEEPYYPVYENPVKFGKMTKSPKEFVTYFASKEQKPYSNTSADFDLHNLIPKPPKPYETWDEPIGPPEGPAIM